MSNILEEFAYSAGLFEGEGWVTKPHKRNGWRLGISMTDKEPLDRISKTFGGNVLGPYKRYGPAGQPYKSSYYWSIHGYYEVKRFYDSVKYYLSPRRIKQFEGTLKIVPINTLATIFSCGEDSNNGYNHHRKAKEVPCFMCRFAHIKYGWEWAHPGKEYKLSSVLIHKYRNFLELAGLL